MNKKFNLDASLNIQKDLVVQGDLQVKGSTKTVDTETLTVKDNLIMVNGAGETVTGVISDNCLMRALLKAGTVFTLKENFVSQDAWSILQYSYPGDEFTFENKEIPLKCQVTYYKNGVKQTTTAEIIRSMYSSPIGFYTILNKNISHVSGRYDYTNSVDVGDLGNWLVEQPVTVTVLEDTFIYYDAGLNFLKETTDAVFEEVRISMASPVLVGDTLKIGEGIATKDKDGNIIDFTFNEGAAQAIATRDDNIPNNSILYYDSENNTISSVPGLKVSSPNSGTPVLCVSDSNYDNLVEFWPGTAWFKDKDSNFLSVQANKFSHQTEGVVVPHKDFSFPSMKNLEGDSSIHYDFTFLVKDNNVQDGAVLSWDEKNEIVKDTKFKTINGESLLGEGNIELEIPEVPEIVVDSALSTTSTNPIQNKAVTATINQKQDKLVSGSNIKTVNGVSLVGGGDVVITADGQIIPMDTDLSLTSENTVQNKAISFELLKNGNQVRTSANITEVGTLTPGTISTSTGADQGNTNRVRTGFIEVTSKDLYLINRSEYLAQLYYYSANTADSLLGFISASGGDIKIPAEAAYIRIVFRKVTESTFTADEMTTVKLNAYLQTIEEIPNRVNTTFVKGYINTTTGAEVANYARLRSDYILSNENIYFVNKTNFIPLIFAFDYDKSNCRYYEYEGNENIQHNGYIRVALKKSDGSNFTDTEIAEANNKFIIKTDYNAPAYWKEHLSSKRVKTTFVRGTVNNDTGVEVASYARLRSGYVLSNENLRIVNRTDFIPMMILYDFGKNVIHYIDNLANTEKNIQHNGYVRFVLRKPDGTNFTDYEINEAHNNFLILHEENVIPNYWKDHLAEKYNNIYNNGMTMGGRGDGVIFLTDIHYENNNLMSPLLVKEIQKNTNINKLVLGGDIFNQDNNKTKAVGKLRSCTSLFGETPYALAIGNHDTNTCLVNRTEEATIHNGQVYDICVRQFEDKSETEGKTYFYFDNKAQKIRYFVLNSGDGWSASESTLNDYIEFSEQLAWLSEKAGELDSDWNIVVFQHIFFNAGVVSSSSETTIGTLGNQVISTLDVIHNDPTKANVFAIIAGHVHRDFSTLTNSGYYCISTTCDAGGASSSDYDPDHPTRPVGTTEEQAFDVFQFDIKNKSIYATRIGVGENREWHY